MKIGCRFIDAASRLAQFIEGLDGEDVAFLDVLGRGDPTRAAEEIYIACNTAIEEEIKRRKDAILLPLVASDQ